MSTQHIRQGLATIAAGVVFALALTGCGAEEPAPAPPATAQVAPAAPVPAPVVAPAAPVPAPVVSMPPKPALVLTGLEYYAAGGKEWTRYRYAVTNRAEYPDELFAPAPDLAPCGNNTNASRTWVDFYDESGKRLYGFCALEKSDSLDGIWFAVETSVAPPKMVYIKMTDRKTDTVYQSNLAPTNRDPRLQ